MNVIFPLCMISEVSLLIALIECNPRWSWNSGPKYNLDDDHRTVDENDGCAFNLQCVQVWKCPNAAHSTKASGYCASKANGPWVCCCSVDSAEDHHHNSLPRNKPDFIPKPSKKPRKWTQKWAESGESGESKTGLDETWVRNPGPKPASSVDGLPINSWERPNVADSWNPHPWSDERTKSTQSGWNKFTESTYNQNSRSTRHRSTTDSRIVFPTEPWTHKTMRTTSHPNPRRTTSEDSYTPSSYKPWTRSSSRSWTLSTSKTWQHSTEKPRSRSTTKSWTHSTAKPWSYSTTKLWTHSTTQPWSHSTTKSWIISSKKPKTPSTTKSWTHSTPKLWSHSTSESWMPSTKKQFSRSTAKPWMQSTTKSSRYSTTKSWSPSSTDAHSTRTTKYLGRPTPRFSKTPSSRRTSTTKAGVWPVNDERRNPDRENPRLDPSTKRSTVSSTTSYSRTSTARRSSPRRNGITTPLPNVNDHSCGIRDESSFPSIENIDVDIAYPSSRNGRKRQTFQRIVGGEEAEPFSWPWVAALYKMSSTGGKRFLSAGSLINENFVLSAAHPFTPEDLRSSSYVVMLGTHNAQDAIAEYKVSSVLQHPQYEQRFYYHDIALLRLERPVAFNDFVMPLCLPSPNAPLLRDRDLEGKNVTVAGWGDDSFGGKSSRVLKEATFPIMTRRSCNASYVRVASNRFPKGITENMLCAGSPNGGKDACQGDSGGPLMSFERGRYTQVGIVSFGYKCGDKEFPGVYTKVAPYLSWIAEHTERAKDYNYDYELGR